MGNEHHARRFAVISGKGGVGKTFITANLAAAMAARGKRTLVLDGDLGLANLDVLVGVNPILTLRDVFSGNHELEEAILNLPEGFDLLPAASGLFEGTLMTPALAADLESLLSRLESRYDAILFDAGAGIGEVVMFFARVADDILVVVTPEPTSLTDAYATIKVLALHYGKKQFSLIVNQAPPEHPFKTGGEVAAHLQHVVSRFLACVECAPIQVRLAGAIPADPAVPLAIGRQKLLIRTDRDAPSTHGISRLAHTLCRS